jgi:hypothetical protein
MNLTPYPSPGLRQERGGRCSSGGVRIKKNAAMHDRGVFFPQDIIEEKRIKSCQSLINPVTPVYCFFLS